MNLSDINRRLENLIRLGTIAQVDYETRMVRVKSGELLSNWLPWPASVGKNYIRWKPLREGTQVIMGSPSGDFPQAKIIGFLFTDSIAPDSNSETLDIIEFDDGTALQYDSGESVLTAECVGDVDVVAGGKAKLQAEGAITVKTPSSVTIDSPNAIIKGKLTVEKDIECSQKITAATDVVAAGISLTKHKHPTPDGMSDKPV